VPIEKIVSRYYKSIQQCVEVVPWVERLDVFDNSREGADAWERLFKYGPLKQFEPFVAPADMPEWVEAFMPFNTISVIGLGYIGLPTAAVIASRRKKVIGVDISQQAVDTINRGEIHIVEPELDMLVHAAVKEGYLRATTTPEPADAFLIAVPTPFKREAGKEHVPDLSYIRAASLSVAPVLKPGDLVILESTSPVGATEQMEAWLAEARPDLSFPSQVGEASDIRVAHCPERVLPGHVVRELVENDRVIGGMTPKLLRGRLRAL
jgi:UDP-N-acetyl-D-mannosaminuronic acid dehydrogenase